MGFGHHLNQDAELEEHVFRLHQQISQITVTLRRISKISSKYLQRKSRSSLRLFATSADHRPRSICESLRTMFEPTFNGNVPASHSAISSYGRKIIRASSRIRIMQSIDSWYTMPFLTSFIISAKIDHSKVGGFA